MALQSPSLCQHDQDLAPMVVQEIVNIISMSAPSLFVSVSLPEAEGNIHKKKLHNEINK